MGMEKSIEITEGSGLVKLIANHEYGNTVLLEQPDAAADFIRHSASEPDMVGRYWHAARTATRYVCADNTRRMIDEVHATNA